jgi:hypothetical protein
MLDGKNCDETHSESVLPKLNLIAYPSGHPCLLKDYLFPSSRYTPNFLVLAREILC